ncbi:Uncharacterised protein [Cedecea davisae]|uniref:Uncharacterized protein n=1 Tax=Cedecea davisae DSM 4568 TaxID=566551 RepID=S3JID6_9ENTR|nr:hypothetical protein [Cedecea davisae]EPF12969.1 hypothetical protein HMPREF0201_04572 [Cedecea davisae DSM 4568]SUX37190.1 Uncharacterised protein [Cedecea davisae]
MPHINSATLPSPIYKAASLFDKPLPKEQPEKDIWFDAQDQIEIDETWFDTSDIYYEETANLRVPFTEDCRRSIQRLLHTMGEYSESRIISECLSKILPEAPTNIIMAAKSIYTAVTQRTNIDTASLQTLLVASSHLPDNINVFSHLAAVVRDTIKDWAEDTCLRPYLEGEADNTYANLWTALAVTAIAARYWMADRGGPERAILKVPTFIANLFIRANYYWNALGRMAGNHSSPPLEPQRNTEQRQQESAFEVDTQVEMTQNTSDKRGFLSTLSKPQMTAFMSNSTITPELLTRATVQNRATPYSGDNQLFSVPEKAHTLVVEQLRHKNGLSDLQYCATRHTESRQQGNEKIITNTHLNTQCDATPYPAHFEQGKNSLPPPRPADGQLSTYGHSFATEKTLISSSSEKTGLSDEINHSASTSLLTSLANALHETGNFLSHYDPLIFPGATALPMESMSGSRTDDEIKIKNRHHPLSPDTKNANRKIIHLLKAEGFLAPKKLTKEKLLTAATEYLFSQHEATYDYNKKIELFAKKILTAGGMWGGDKEEKISTAQAEKVIRHWVFNNVLGMSPEEYIEGKMKTADYHYSVRDVNHLLSMDYLVEKKYFHFKHPLSHRRYLLDIMWKHFLAQEIPFLSFRKKSVLDLNLRDKNFANLYTGSSFLQSVGVEKYSSEEAMTIGENIWNSAINEEITENFPLYKTPARFFALSNAVEHSKEEESDIATDISNYIQYRKGTDELLQDINKKYNTYMSETHAWLSKGKLADKIIDQCAPFIAPIPDQFMPINVPGYNNIRVSYDAKKIAKERYLDDRGKPCDIAPENLSDEYKRQTARVADSFRELDKYIILSAISSLSNDEVEFINSPDSIIRPADSYVQLMQPGSFIATKKIFIENTDLFSVKLANQERIYALKAEVNDGNGYTISRVDRDLRLYFTSKILGDGLNDYNPTWQKIEDSKDIYNFDVYTTGPALKGSGSNLDILVNLLSQKHREHLYNSLYEIGHTLSNKQTLWNTIKHLIPFYDCIEGIINNDPEKAVPACLLDAVAFIPSLGAAASLSGRFGTGLARGLLGRKTLSRLPWGAYLPSQGEIRHIAVSALYALDPGFGVITSISNKFASKIVSRLAANKKTANLAENILSSNALDRLPQGSSAESLVATLPERKVSVPVTAVGIQDSNTVYVRHNPATGELFGKRYIINSAGELIPAVINADHIRYFKKEITGITNWHVFDSKNILKEKIIPHESGFHTSLDAQGKKTGKLFLIQEQGWVPVTEISKGRYYIAGEGNSRVIIEKKNNTFEVAEHLPVNKPIANEYLDSTWCPLPSAGRRRLMMNDWLECVQPPELAENTVSYRYNVLLPTDTKNRDFDVIFRGVYNTDMLTRLNAINTITDTLFFENRNIYLIQDPVDATKYEKAFSDKNIEMNPDETHFTDTSDANLANTPILTKNEKLAVRRWTAVDEELPDLFSDGMADTTKLGLKPLNYDLNHKLAYYQKLTDDERNMVRLFDSALNKIPSQKGEFIRIAEYPNRNTPWDSQIKPGDTVTNYPCYMSTSADQNYILGSVPDENTNAIIIYRFENTFSSKPLLRGAASLVDEQESLFRRNSFFKVKQIAISEEVPGGGDTAGVTKRIVVTLDEIAAPQSGLAKNIHTGETVNTHQ